MIEARRRSPGSGHGRPVMLLSALVTLLCAAMPATASEADVVYVTDELRLGLYQSEETAGRALKTLVSGTRLDVLERSLMSIRVRTEDGDQGWVKTAFVVDKEPARRRLARVEAAQAEAAAALADRDRQLGELTERVETLNAALASAEQGVEDLPALRAENETLKTTLAAGGVRVPLPWLAAAVIAALAIGAFIGYAWLDRRVRRQFGGLKIY
ncbi:MAG: TIGR04211 family SH3 domain-containing protein [Pseudomonadales bacterium]